MKKSSLYRLISAGVLASSLSLGLTACNGDAVAIGIGAGAIGAVVGGAIVDSHHNHYPRYPRCRTTTRTICTDYWDHWGRRQRDCRHVYDRCGRYYSATLDGQSDKAVSTEAAYIAETYHLSFDSAEKVMAALDSAKTGDATKARALGLNESELVSLALGRSLSADAKAKLATELNTTQDNAASFIEGIATKVRQQSGDSQSALWKACRAGGKWRTPQNNSCGEQWWPGCDPSNGATFCAAL